MQTQTVQKPNPFKGWKSASDQDDWTLYRQADFLEIQKSEKGAFSGFLLGYKFTKKKLIPMFYFVTQDGEVLKCFGSGNLTSQLSEVFDQALNHMVGIIYDGQVEINMGDKLGKQDVNQWRVYVESKAVCPKKLLDLKEEIDGLILEGAALKEHVQEKRDARQ